MKSKAMPIRPLLLGHRGARGEKSIAENTLASFDLAIASGCDGFEFDVRLSADGQPVICHDAKSRGHEVARSKADALGLPLLAAVLTRYGRTAFLDIELKVPGLESALLLALREFPPKKEFVVSSFLPEVLADLRVRSQSVPLGIICDQKKQLAQARKLDVQYVISQHSLIDKKLVQDLHTAERKIFAWTVNDKKSMLRLADWGVDGIISDDTELLVRTFQGV